MTERLCDMHVHLLGLEPESSGCYLRQERISPILRRRLATNYGLRTEQLNSAGVDQQIARQIIDKINASKIDHAVLLALDEVYLPTGKVRSDLTTYHVNNDYVANLAQSNNKILFGASIHPYRKDAIDELERMAERDACLVKWLPSAQNIDLSHPLCVNFYKTLSRLGIPLLCHMGVEHVLPGGSNDMNHPELLVHALEQGVTVIAAHCGSQIFITDENQFKSWKQMTHKHPNLYGDISAFGYPLRRLILSQILQDPVLSQRIVYGSDFPSSVMLSSFLGKISIQELRQLKQLTNPFDKNIATMQAAGVPAATFNRVYELLRLDPAKITA